ncbi:putative metal-dependent hydrolase [Salmonella enterica subsp. arizonae]|uniref:Putative metal-dependent hydrolase n=1 Tax=Salmonella enterica subsp. arizonae TaxID=59203 RepID=A0A379TL45_SALER|nr:putative metal-dependent hydrolase [Salmonella enterica subsp. arizonae]
MTSLPYLQGYPEHLLAQVRALIAGQGLGTMLEKRYPGAHDYATDKALYHYTQELKSQFLRNAPPINKVMYDSKIHVLKNALGLAYRRLARSGRQTQGKGGDTRRHRVSQRSGAVSADDCGSRTGAPERKRA